MTALPLTRRWWLKTLAINGLIALIVFGAIQLIPTHGPNPPVQHEPVWDAPETRALAVAACFDCHSNETHWPWYAQIAPVAWVISYDVIEGREALNFSEWGRFERADLIDPTDPFPPKTLSERIAAEIHSGRMPPGTYQLLHADARLSAAEKNALIAGLVATVQQNQAAE